MSINAPSRRSVAPSVEPETAEQTAEWPQPTLRDVAPEWARLHDKLLGLRERETGLLREIQPLNEKLKRLGWSGEHTTFTIKPSVEIAIPEAEAAAERRARHVREIMGDDHQPPPEPAAPYIAHGPDRARYLELRVELEAVQES